MIREFPEVDFIIAYPFQKCYEKYLLPAIQHHL